MAWSEPLPPTMLVEYASTIIRLALPKWDIFAFSSSISIRLSMGVAPVMIAISLS